MLLRILFLVLPAAYLILRLFLPPRRPHLRLRLAAVPALLLVSQAHVIERYFFKSLAGPDMPAWLLIVQTWLYVALLLAFLMTLLLDATRLVAWLAQKMRPRRNASAAFSPERRALLRQGAGALLYTAAVPAASLGLSGWGVAKGCAVPEIRRMTLALPDLPPGLDGLVIAHLADLHIGPLTSLDWTRQVVALTNAARPDLVCLTGDLTDGRMEYRIPGPGTRRDAVRELSGLSARLGVFGCPGNHEYYSDFAGWMAEYEKAGIRMLADASLTLERGGAKLALAGLNDAGNSCASAAPSTNNAVLDVLPRREDGAFRLLMDHRPGRAAANAEAGIDLQLSGHTHGGQCLGMDSLVARYNRGFVRGWYRVAGMALYVTPGAGLWPGLPVRLGVPAEIAVITLKRGMA